jgi:phosphatidylinositol alpha-1,6-mannosyltransferase
MCKKTLLLTLQTFSAPGGIQKMSRTLAYALHQIGQETNNNLLLWSLYDKQADHDERYIPANNFKGFGKRKLHFIYQSIKKGISSERVILTHVNLSLIAVIIKLFNPRCKIWLIAHGIEVWRPLKRFKKTIWKLADSVICVSNYTLKKVAEFHHIASSKCIVVNNALDPFMLLPTNFSKPVNLMERYKIRPDTHVIFTLTRLASTERYKGYEQVLKAIPRLKETFNNIKYVLTGPHDIEEKLRIAQLIADLRIEDSVIITGFINEDELTDHFLLADLFVLPSKKEGFGIVFIEAQACGLPVICGNEDGSLDAICNGELGTAIDADDLQQLEQTITGYLNEPLTNVVRQNIQQKCLKHFSYAAYQHTLKQLITA